MPRVLHAILLSLVAPGCSVPPVPAEPPEAPLEVVRPPLSAPAATLAPRAGAGDVAVARVGGVVIRRSDLGDFSIRYFRDQANEALTHLVDERIIDAEVRAYGISLPAGALDKAVSSELRERENTIRVQFGSQVSLERYLTERFGASLAEHRRDLERLLHTRLLRDRVIRFHQLGEDRITARDAIFTDLDSARRAASAARDGADLDRLAREQGLGSEMLPSFPRDELTPDELAAAVFSLSEGEVSDPIAVDEGVDTRYHVFKVVKRMPGRDVAWAAVAADVEAGLADRPLERDEYRQWARQMREKHQVEVLR